MAWTRLALLQAAGQSEQALVKMADLFGYERLPEPERDAGIAAQGEASASRSAEAAEETRTKPKRSPARFPRITKIIPLETGRDDLSKPEYLSETAPRLRPQDMPSGTYSFAAADPVMPMARLLPLLFNSLNQPRAGNGLDQRLLLRRIARGQALCHLPKRHRPRWPQRMQIIVDASQRLEPYWSDFAYIVRQLRQLLGDEAVEAIRFDEDTLGTPESRCIRWPTQDRDQARCWQVPAHDVAILLLGDLGGEDSRASVRWQRQLGRLQSRPAPVLTLSPLQAAPDDNPYTRWLRPNPLNDGITVSRHPASHGFNLQATQPHAMVDILAWLSALPLIDTGLLRRLRRELSWGDSSLEALIWNHPDVRRTGLGIRLHDEVAENYRRHYQQRHAGSDLARRFWETVTEHHQPAYLGLRQLERLNYCVLENQDDAEVRDYFQRLCATAFNNASDANQRHALQMQCKTILASRPQTIWNSKFDELAYSIYAIACRDQIRAGNWPEELEPGFKPESLSWLLPEVSDSSLVAWNFVQIGSQAELQCLMATDSDPALRYLFQIVAPKAFPPQIIRGDSALAKRQILADGTRFAIAEKSGISIESGNRCFHLDAIAKPTWASRICLSHADSRAARLTVSIPWAGREFDNIGWYIDEGHSGSWALPSPFGEDLYGLYADLTVNNVTQRFRWIEPGTFMMGSPADELEREWGGDLPGSETHHPVTLTQGFWLADTAVTQAFWRAVLGGDNPSGFQDSPEHPVEQASWDDVWRFIARLNELMPGLHAQLPTEAQWEYACRAGTATPFSFGANITPEQVNYDGDYPYAGGEKGLNRGKTVAVKSLPANAWGLYEMHGNVWEWCADAWQDNLGESAVVDPYTPGEPGGDRVFRGGSWISLGRNVRSAFREHDAPAERGRGMGFRLALGHAEPRRTVESGAQNSRRFARSGSGLSELRPAGWGTSLLGELRGKGRKKK
ncbi:formylglycine-generating enzyme family protein [Methylomonas sp. MV1]|uniref:formylglycine-generating enzyme family protein n=1 Tax=Methylomonas sp. MV1 TaxID=3073620 RepID=UPI0028A38742|nr:formylglycine-generating enzyme family protein [Methylomonas sp. MV1]MDT4329104.1 formylglycine-generating enzyme family protein [Methylomonas sp. MV1]